MARDEKEISTLLSFYAGFVLFYSCSNADKEPTVNKGRGAESTEAVADSFRFCTSEMYSYLFGEI